MGIYGNYIEVVIKSLDGTVSLKLERNYIKTGIINELHESCMESVLLLQNNY